MAGCRIQFRTVGVFPADNISGKLYKCHLHAQADSQKRNPLLPGVLSRKDHAFCAPGSEAARNDHAVNVSQPGLQGLASIESCGRSIESCSCFFPAAFFQFFRIHPLNFHFRPVRDPAVMQCLHNTEVGVMQRRIFTHQGYGHLSLRVVQIVHHFNPVPQSGLRAWDLQTLAGCLGQALLFHHQGHFIDGIRIQVLDHV